MARILILLAIVTSVPAWPQARFEVVSIKPSPPGMTARDNQKSLRGDRFENRATTVGDILDMLNGFQLFRVVGGPDWIRTDRYDIEAKADRPLKAEDLNDALMALLVERFQLKSHRETREVAGLVLRAPRPPAGLKQAAPDEKHSMRMDGGDYVLRGASISVLTNLLSNLLTEPVMDETGLNGNYDFELAVSRVGLQTGMTWADRVREAAETLGFRLENRRIPLEVTVVDRCERPSAN
jgi:uncharacterized protein (TIGR03435 family)